MVVCKARTSGITTSDPLCRGISIALAIIRSVRPSNQFVFLRFGPATAQRSGQVQRCQYSGNNCLGAHNSVTSQLRLRLAFPFRRLRGQPIEKSSHNSSRVGAGLSAALIHLCRFVFAPFDFPKCMRPAMALIENVVSFRKRAAMARMRS